jgi:hexosaminidase
MMRVQVVSLLGFSFALFSAQAAAQQPPQLPLMPVPASVQPRSGALRIDSSFSVSLTGRTEPRLDRAVQRFMGQLNRQTGIPFPSKATGSAKPTLVIHTDHASKEVQELGEDESYVLEVTQDGAKLTAPTPLGTMHGLQTFLQLVEVSPDGFAAPAIAIQDKPRFPWRGLLIDVSRHFIPLDILKRNLDGMEAVKMNVLHLHLSDNQGFRVESKKFPKLHELGSDGLYYTQDQIRELIAYGRNRGIRILPEFDMPGHSTAWFVGYPELASGPGPYQIERNWGIFDPAMDPTNEKTYKFLDDFVAEMTKLFPDGYFHIGGDEVNGKQWDANPKIQEFKRAHNLQNNEALQAYFSQRIQKIVTKHGKVVVGWDEILVPGVPKNIVIQCWRGQASLSQAVAQGYRGILSSGYYLDLGWPAVRHYAVEPLSGPAAKLTPEQRQLVLGGESSMWTEYVSPENIDSRIWPRNAAIADRLWSPQNVTDPASMYTRLNGISERLEWLGLTHSTYYRQVLQRIAGESSTADDLAALRALADVVEPVKNYKRAATAPAQATSLTPLNRVVDAVPLESDAARRFSEADDQFIAASCHDPALEARLRAQFIAWRDNDAKLQPLVQRSFLVKEVAQTSKDLASLGAMGVAALDFIGQAGGVPEDWKTRQLATIEQIKAPKAQLLLMPAVSEVDIFPLWQHDPTSHPAAAVQKLIEAASRGGSCSSLKP